MGKTGVSPMPWQEEVFFIASFLLFVALIALGVAVSNGWLGGLY